MGICRSQFEIFAQLTKHKGWKYVLKNGKEFSSVDVTLSLDLRRKHKCQVKQCYANCQTIAVYDRRWTYFEGSALSEGLPIPVDHAWLVGRSNQLVDPTWFRKKNPITGIEYFGLSIPPDFIIKRWMETGYYEPMLHHYVADRMGEGKRGKV
jgi:hypothetical protein